MKDIKNRTETMGSTQSTSQIDNNSSNTKTVTEVNTNKDNIDNKLLSLNIDDIPNVIFKDKCIRGRVIDVYDGDTITVVFILGDMPIKYKIILYGIKAPEIRLGKGRTQLEKNAGLKCRDYVKSILQNQLVTIIIKDNDIYSGRLIGEVYLNSQTNVGNLLVNMGYAKPYNGTKEKWTTKELNHIISL